jgi:hypothetical protein
MAGPVLKSLCSVVDIRTQARLILDILSLCLLASDYELEYKIAAVDIRGRYAELALQ